MHWGSAFRLALGFTLACACGPGDKPSADPDGGGIPGDCAEDSDHDCIPDSVEGCGAEPEPNRDNDGNPDWYDTDSDNDGIADAVEADRCGDPRDTDEDGLPDYVDTDSDNDGALDQYEDRNGDGEIGNCTTTCTGQDQCRDDEHCAQPPDMASPGFCVSNTCLGGETDPHSGDTDGDGTADGIEGTFICNPQTEDNPYGLKRIKYADSAATTYALANWRVALEVEAVEREPVITAPLGTESAYAFDLTGIDAEVAGFVASRTTNQPSALDEATWAVGALRTVPGIANAIIRVSGTRGTSLDGFDTVRGTTLLVETASPMTAPALRAALLPALLGRSPVEVVTPDVGWTGPAERVFVVAFQTLQRAPQAQVLFMGSVTRQTAFDDRERATGFFADDLSNGTGLAESMNGEAIECEQFTANQVPTADIIWVVDESGSMSDDRSRVAAYADAFFAKAIAAGLDFRMGVTDMDDENDGTFATRQAGGTLDRWILRSAAAQFADAIEDPSGPDPGDGGFEHGLTQGRAAIMRHLPRNDDDAQRFRERAQIVVIYVTDEKPDEIEEDVSDVGDGNQELSAGQITELLGFLASYIADFTFNGAVAHLIAVPLPFTSPACTDQGETAYGYAELVAALGGQVGSICQDDLGPTLDAIIDTVIGEASPIVLSKFPISATIAVARDNIPVPRSRDTGWDYRAASNSIVFYNMDFNPLVPSDIVVSYRRWETQVPIE